MKGTTTRGALAGIVIYSMSSKEMKINSASASYFEGMVYAPNGKIMINSDSTIGANSNFSVFIAKEFEINSNSSLVLNGDYASSNVPGIPTLGGQRAAIFE